MKLDDVDISINNRMSTNFLTADDDPEVVNNAENCSQSFQRVEMS